mmetsp:Transcript_177029/g.567766  ORF Transcript_177029/g.567766 Transcript_177029/m.567766 type:complete len:256 (-) Transcript_177029:119-886(-)
MALAGNVAGSTCPCIGTPWSSTCCKPVPTASSPNSALLSSLSSLSSFLSLALRSRLGLLLLRLLLLRFFSRLRRSRSRLRLSRSRSRSRSRPLFSFSFSFSRSLSRLRRSRCLLAERFFVVSRRSLSPPTAFFGLLLASRCRWRLLERFLVFEGEGDFSPPKSDFLRSSAMPETRAVLPLSNFLRSFQPLPGPPASLSELKPSPKPPPENPELVVAMLPKPPPKPESTEEPPMSRPETPPRAKGEATGPVPAAKP